MSEYRRVNIDSKRAARRVRLAQGRLDTLGANNQKRTWVITALLSILALNLVPGWLGYTIPGLSFGALSGPEFSSSSVAWARSGSPKAPFTVRPAPEFPAPNEDQWINSKPLQLSELEGKVIIINFWTFNCSNCYNSFPWLSRIEEIYGRVGLKVIGVHSPEFDAQRNKTELEAKVQEWGLKHPILIDNDFAYWERIGNRAWPSFYVVDRQGRIRGIHSGETRVGDRQAIEIERLIEQVLAEG